MAQAAELNPNKVKRKSEIPVRANPLSYILGALLLAGVVLIFWDLWNVRYPAVRITWESVGEVETLGYNVLRGEMPGGPFVQVNERMIPVQGDIFDTNTYTYQDYPDSGRVIYYYLIERQYSSSPPSRGELITVQMRRIPAWEFWIGIFLILLSLVLFWRRARKLTSDG